ncbi:ABC transporter permease [Chryseotalea sanaruensis]|uniref:ABC transporter permease n=1 Tax=Chryseotalea sanaruensis TaxID=2482724 RepID=A0A401U622_9BACT|nr:ABC transporter permease [Chryseotalea sanaruensis]GCC50371.1 ABC transporter permease [Chryseotalea sanaruensis]
MNTTGSRTYLFTKGIDSFLKGVTDASTFTVRFFKESFLPPFHFHEVINQSFEIGLKSLSLITVTGFIIGIVFTKQSRPSLEDFGATSWLPSLMGIAIIRALGPLVTALICAGKVGSSIGAEIGSMKVTEQIEAMEVSAINPFKYLIVTRVFATTLTIPVLSLYCICVGLFGSYINVHAQEATGFVTFYHNAFSSVSFLDINTSVIKSIVYGLTIGLVGCYKGYNARKGTRGVGRAANQAVIVSMFLIFLEEIVIVQITNWIRYY